MYLYFVEEILFPLHIHFSPYRQLKKFHIKQERIFLRSHSKESANLIQAILELDCK
jgi:hypothetical protein